MTITRKELYRQVWAKAVVKLAKEYGLSDVGFAKLCKRNNIPRPSLGYWAKKAAGQNLPTVPLPRADEDWDITITSYEQSPDDPCLRAEAEKALSQAVPENPITVPETLRGAHPLVSHALHILELSEKDNVGLLQPPKGCLDVMVSKDSLRRALRIMDALIKTFEGRGYPVTVLNDKDSGATVVELMDVKVPIGIREIVASRKEEADDDGNVEGRYVFRHDRFKFRTAPSGDLCLEIEPRRGYYSSSGGRRRKWSDGQRGKLEDYLSSFIVGVINIAVRKREAKQEAERREREWQEQERQRAKQEAARAAMMERINKERAKVDKLSTDAAAWTKSRQIRDYIAAVRAKAKADGQDIGAGSEDGKWLIWAEQQADRLDPLKVSPHSILDDEEKYRRPW